MKKHDAESKGSNPRDHHHPRRPFWKHAHRDWRVWFAVVVMLAMMVVYVLTEDLRFRPGRHATQPAPALDVP